MPHVGKIQVTTVTGNSNEASTDGKVSLGIGGREFRLNKSGDQFKRGQTDNFIIGDGTNIQNPDINGLPTVSPATGGQKSPGIEFDWLQNNLFPTYIRLEEESHDWNIESVDVQAEEYGVGPTGNIIKYRAFANPNEDNIWLGEKSGFILGLVKLP